MMNLLVADAPLCSSQLMTRRGARADQTIWLTPARQSDSLVLPSALAVEDDEAVA